MLLLSILLSLVGNVVGRRNVDADDDASTHWLGRLRQSSNHSVLCAPCEVGSYKKAGEISDKCTASCPEAGYCAITYRSCLPCLVGYFNNQTGQAKCERCRNGTVTDVERSVECDIVCPAGQTNNDEWTACDACRPGTRNPLNGSVCEPCLAGYYSNASGALVCAPCEAGYYGDAPGLTRCTPCGAGKYQSSLAATTSSSCVPCLAGYYCPNDATARPVPCDVDQYCPPGAKQQLPCPLLYSAPQLSEHCSPSEEFYAVVGGVVVFIIAALLALAVRAVRRRDNIERRSLLPNKADAGPVYQGL